MLKISKKHGIDLLESIAAISNQPAKIAGLTAGNIAIDNPADCIIVEPNETWQLSKSTVNSKGKNSPYLNQTLTGRCLQTIIDGQLVDLD